MDTLSEWIAETPPVTGDFSFVKAYDGHIGSATMNTLNFTCALLLTLLLSISCFASSMKLFFTTDELTEMGVRLELSDIEGEGAAA
jgi:hypothetical protein